MFRKTSGLGFCVLLTIALLPAGPALSGCGSQNSDSGATGGRGPVLTAPGGSADLDKKCTRVETASAVTIVRPEPFDVIIVADNSGSIGWSRDSLAKGLQGLLKYVHGQQVRFFVLTPTQYGASSAGARAKSGAELVTYENDVTRAAHENAMTEYVQSCTDSGGQPIDCERRFYLGGEGIQVSGAWHFQMPEPIAAVTPDMTPDAVAQQQAKISAAILALGTTGAELEQPICTLNRYIQQAREQLPKHAVFVVLSDEDDASKPDQCLAAYSYAPRASGTTDSSCESGCDYYEYTTQFSQTLRTIEAKCIQVDDQGVPHPESYTTISSANGADLCDGTRLTCSAEEVAFLQKFCGADSILEGCYAKCDGSSGFLCVLERPDRSLDVCTQSFTEAGTTYQNLADYCQRTRNASPWHDCEVRGYKRNGGTLFDGEEKITQVVEGSALSQMIDAFHRDASAAFGAKGYFVESIVFDPTFGCALQSGQSYGSTLRQLASSAEDVFPICNDYAPALQRIQGFAQRLVQNVFTLALKSDEELESVSIRGLDGGTRTLATSTYTFDRERETLTVAPGTLTPSDASLDLVIADSCIEIIR